jgi:PIN domain nuclease of toxin-antitoxin system
MRILVDTAIWFQYARNLPMPAPARRALDDPQTEAFVCAISSMEIVRKWRIGKLACPDPLTWIDQALEGFGIVAISEPIARQAALWDWDHRDPSDRLIAAGARIQKIELWHCDTVLKDLSGFPQRYFKAPPL